MDYNNANQTYSLCDVSILDSGGGNDSLGYDNDEDITITICPSSDSTIIVLEWLHFNLSIEDDNPDPGSENLDYMLIWDGEYASGPPTLGVYSSNELQGEFVSATNYNLSGCLSLRFISNSIGTGQFEALIHCVDFDDLPTVHAEIVNSSNSAGDSIFVCSGAEVSLYGYAEVGEENSLESLNWLFDNVIEFEVDNNDTISYVFNSPGFHNVKYIAVDAYGVNITEELTVFVYPIEDFSLFPYDTTVCISDGSFYLSVNPLIFTSYWGPNFHQSCNLFYCLEDDVGVLKEFPMFISGYEPGTTVNFASDIISIDVDIEHSYIGDFALEVMCPNGQIITLHQPDGGYYKVGIPIEDPEVIDCDDLSTYGEAFHYSFKNNADLTWAEAADISNDLYLDAGNYQPIDPLSELLGCPLNGVWSLLYTDFTETNNGSMPCWSILFDSTLTNSNSILEFNTTIGNDLDSSYWNPDGENIIDVSSDGNSILIDPQSTGVFEYTYSMINSLGCSTTLTSVINVLDVDCEVWLDVDDNEQKTIKLPQVFSPNGDGNNDFFGLSKEQVQDKDFSMKIYDVLGNLVFTTTNRDEKWNGTHSVNSSELPMGVYVYLVQYRSINNEGMNAIRGKVLLVK